MPTLFSTNSVLVTRVYACTYIMATLLAGAEDDVCVMVVECAIFKFLLAQFSYFVIANVPDLYAYF